MSLETKLRFAAGITMAVLVISIILSGVNELNLLLLTCIQVKVFHEMRQVNLTSSIIHLEKKQVMSDWTLFTICMLLSLNLIYVDHAKVLIWYLILYTLWFVLWVIFILDDFNTISTLGDHLLHTFYVHVSVLYTVIQPTVIHLNILNGGIFWFLFPCSLVVINDTAAYLCGKYFGKRKLLYISPNKTLEGFIGGWIITVLFAYKLSDWLAQFDNLTRNHYNTNIYNNIQFHGIIIGIFASSIAPFGGYFSSAIKRAGKIKDFGQWIPGHGGLLDRVDCQLFMAVFTYVYFKYISSL